jgi:hypothetical protein
LKKKRYDVVGKTCTVSDITGNNTIIEDGHLRSVAHLLRFGEEYDEKYLGTTEIRGILCDHWFINFTGDLGSYKNHYWTYEMYFSVKEWSIRGSRLHRIPVSAYLHGYRYNSTTGRHGITPDVYRVWEFIDFVPGMKTNFTTD